MYVGPYRESYGLMYSCVICCCDGRRPVACTHTQSTQWRSNKGSEEAITRSRFAAVVCQRTLTTLDTASPAMRPLLAAK